MGIEKIFGKCDDQNFDFVGTVVGEPITPQEAAQRYFNRVNCDDPIEGHLISLQALRDFIKGIDDTDQADDIKYVRIWKGTSKEYGSCIEDQSKKFYLEDLIMTPVFSNGTDVHAEEISETSSLSKAVILSSMRPCPKWCGTREGTSRTFFYERFLDQRTTTNPHNGIDPYDGYIQC